MPVTREGLSALGQSALGLLPKLSLILSALGICVMIGMVVAEIIATQIFSQSLPYAIEWVEYLIPIIVFWGAAYTLREGGHVRADIFLHRLPDRPRQWFFLIGYLLGLVYLIIVFRFTLQLSLNSFRIHAVSFFPVPSPLGPPQMLVAIGIALFAFQLLVEIGKQTRLLYLSYK